MVDERYRLDHKIDVVKARVVDRSAQ